MLGKEVQDEIEENKNRRHGGVPPRNPLEFSLLSTLHKIIMNQWNEV